jgi:carbonyl reductase 1/carbonyl reductase 3
LNENGKIITVGSSAGKTKYLKSDELKNRFKKVNTKEEVFALAKEFYDAVGKSNILCNLDTYAENGWPSWGYGISKLCINTYVTTLP